MAHQHGKEQQRRTSANYPQNKTLRLITCSPLRSNLTKLYKKCEILQLDKL